MSQTLRDKLRTAKAAMDAALFDADNLLSIAAGEAPAEAAAQPPAPIQVPVPPPAPPLIQVPEPPPVPVAPVAAPPVPHVAAPVPSKYHIFAIVPKVFTTCFGNKEDEPKNWQDSGMAYSKAPKCTAGSGQTTLGVALPDRVPWGTVILARMHIEPTVEMVPPTSPNGLWTPGVIYDEEWLCAPVFDVGPWNIKDPYWEEGRRPEAETGTDATSRHTNKAGLDGLPLFWAKVPGANKGTAVQCWEGSPSGYMDLIVIYPPASTVVVPMPIANSAPAADGYPTDQQMWEPGSTPAAPPAATDKLTAEVALARGLSLVDKPVTYALGHEPTIIDFLTLGGTSSDCSGYVNRCFGIDRNVTGENTDAMVADANGKNKFYKKKVGPVKPGGAAFVYPSGNGHDYGHTGLVTAVDENGVPTEVAHCSSGHAAGRAVQKSDPSIFTSRGAILVCPVGME